MGYLLPQRDIYTITTDSITFPLTTSTRIANDSIETYWGDGNDLGIQYNGTNALFSLSSGDFVFGGNMDIEGYISVGNEFALNTNNTAIIGRTVSTNNTGISQLSVKGNYTYTGTSNVYFSRFEPTAISVNNATGIGEISSVYINQPNITIAGGATPLLSANLIVDVPDDQASNNVSVFVKGPSRLDGRITQNAHPQGHIYNILNAVATSDGSSDLAGVFQIDGILTGAAGDTSQLFGSKFFTDISTQAADETIGTIAQVIIAEPNITNNLTGSGSITNTAALHILGEANEGTNNYGFWNAASTRLDGNTTVNGLFGLGPEVVYTISSGAITVTNSNIEVATEGSASTDDLDTINGGSDGDIIRLKARDSSDTVVCKDNTGNLRLSGDFSLDSIFDTLTLMNLGDTLWVEIARSNNA